MTLPCYQYNGEALILKSRKHGEANLILTVFTADLGKMDVLARGVRKAKSRKAGHVEPFMLAGVSLRRSKWLPEVMEAQIRDAFPQCRNSLERIVHASYACELLDSLTQPQDPAGQSQHLFDLLHFTLQTMKGTQPPLTLLSCWYALQILTLTGFQMELQHCTECQREAQPQACYFHLQHGGILCAQCGPAVERAERLPLDEFKTLRFLQRSNWALVTSFKFAAASLRECEGLLRRFVSSILERPLRTDRFRRQIRQ